jgi:hypothetical protein
MVTRATPVQVRDLKDEPDGLFKKVEQTLPDIVQGAEATSDPHHTESARWFYWIPGPGVRCYSYGEWPALAETGAPQLNHSPNY